jgi:hypothetical protein
VAATVEVGRLIGELGGAEPIHRLGSRLGADLEQLVADLVDRLVPRDSLPRAAHELGYGAMTNSYNDIRNAKTIMVMGGNPAEAHPLHVRHGQRSRKLHLPARHR